ncbi:hypothetical protein BC332_01446 [Capsicum chinense]|nr:hypothetical protein BC332_01446 [Capsicum chinense]
MEGEEFKNEQKTPLLDGWKHSRIGRRNSVTSMRGDFLARLPEKVISCVNVDVESSSSTSNIDISKSSCLSKGKIFVKVGSDATVIEKKKRRKGVLVF